MGEGMISDFVAVVELAVQDLRIAVGFFTDHEERSGDVLRFQDVQNLRGVFGIGPVIER